MSSLTSTSTLNHETANLNYFKWIPLFQTEKPYQILMDVPEGCPSSNFGFEAVPAQTIQDLRGRESEFSLDENAFAVRRHPLDRVRMEDWTSQSVEGVYFKEVERILREEVEGVVECVIFDWRLRSSDSVDRGEALDLNDLAQYMRPIETVHIDQSAEGAYKRVHHHLGDRAESLLKKRFRIINVWRPLRHPVEDYPLAVCDGSTVPATSLVTADHVRKFYTGESLYPLHNEAYRWYYLNRQTKDEVLLLKMFDNKEEVMARYCPHTSFMQSDVKEGAKPRESIEVRVLVFSEW